MGDEQRSGAGVRDLGGDNILKRALQPDVERAKRLVHRQQVRRRRKRAGDGETNAQRRSWVKAAEFRFTKTE